MLTFLQVVTFLNQSTNVIYAQLQRKITKQRQDIFCGQYGSCWHVCCDVTEALIEEQVRQLQAEEAARQMGVFNQYQQP